MLLIVCEKHNITNVTQDVLVARKFSALDRHRPRN